MVNKYNATAIGKMNRSSLVKVNQMINNEWIPVPVVIDLYAVFDAMEVDPVIVNALKKMIKPGQRHQKDMLTDLREAKKCLERKIEIEEAKEAWGL